MAPEKTASPKPPKNCAPSSDPRTQPKVSAEFALDRVQLVLAAYGAWRPDDAERYVRSVVETLTEFCEPIVLHVTDPRTGVQARERYLPTVAHIREACLRRFDALMREFEAATRPERQRAEIERSESEAAERSKRPSYGDLLGKYGADGKWLAPMRDATRERKRDERDRATNLRFIEREYHLHGLRPVIWKGVPITLATALQMQAMGKLKIEPAS